MARFGAVISRPPTDALRPFVKTVWAARTSATDTARERVLPTGSVHLAIRLSGPPLRLYETAAAEDVRTVGHAVVGGPRSGFYVREVSGPSDSVGALLHPGAAPLLFGIPAEELADRHTPLALLWGPHAAAELVERLEEAGAPEARCVLLEAALLSRLRQAAQVDPVVAFAVERLASGADVASVVERTGYSHRHFVSLFREGVGLTPKQYARVVRFGAALARFNAGRPVSPGEIAHAFGFSDQAHFTREFRAFTGLTPGEYRLLSPSQPHHVPLRSDSFKTRTRGMGTFTRTRPRQGSLT